MARNILCHSKVAFNGFTSLKAGDVLKINSNWNLLIEAVKVQIDESNKRTLVVAGRYVLAGEINTTE